MKYKVNKIGFYISIGVNVLLLGLATVYFFTPYLDYTVLTKVVPRLCGEENKEIEFCKRLSSKTSDREVVPVAQDYSDLSTCGGFPLASRDGGPSTQYSVCRNSVSGECYYQKISSEPILGCDPEFEKNPYGKEECFRSITSLFSIEGKALNATTNPKDTCMPTTQKYFELKVK